MTVWKPDFDPYLEIHQSLSTNESGIKKGVKTGFRTILNAIPVATGSSYAAVQVTGFTVITSGDTVDVYLNSSKKIQNVSQAFDLIVYGLKG